MNDLKTVLVVEDNDNNFYLMNFLLKSKGYDVVIAKNGFEGVEKAQQLLPDLILMDIQLPIINGYEATRRIREINALKSIPIIAVTSFAMPGDRKKMY